MTRSELWPALPLSEWQDTYTTLHMWTQIVGKIRMTLSAPLNHWWHVTLYVSATGLTTGPIPYPGGVFELRFDFLQHELAIVTSEGGAVTLPLRAESVAEFYSGDDERSGDAGDRGGHPDEAAGGRRSRFRSIRMSATARTIPRRRIGSGGSWCRAAKVFDRFRSKFMGKYSPTHFFWGSFDLA